MADKKSDYPELTNEDQEWLDADLDDVVEPEPKEEVEEAPVKNEGKVWTREGSGPLVRVVE